MNMVVGALHQGYFNQHLSMKSAWNIQNTMNMFSWEHLCQMVYQSRLP